MRVFVGEVVEVVRPWVITSTTSIQHPKKLLSTPLVAGWQIVGSRFLHGGNQVARPPQNKKTKPFEKLALRLFRSSVATSFTPALASQGFRPQQIKSQKYFRNKIFIAMGSPRINIVAKRINKAFPTSGLGLQLCQATTVLLMFSKVRRPRQAQTRKQNPKKKSLKSASQGTFSWP